MNEIISKAILTGLGFASLTKDAIQETARDLVKQSKLSESEGKRLVKDFQDRAVHAEHRLKKKVDSAVRKALKKLDLQQIDHKAPAIKAKPATRTTGTRRHKGMRPAKAK